LSRYNIKSDSNFELNKKKNASERRRGLDGYSWPWQQLLLLLLSQFSCNMGRMKDLSED